MGRRWWTPSPRRSRAATRPPSFGTYTGPGDVTVSTVSRVTGGHVWTMEETTDVTGFIAGTARLLG